MQLQPILFCFNISTFDLVALGQRVIVIIYSFYRSERGDKQEILASCLPVRTYQENIIVITC